MPRDFVGGRSRPVVSRRRVLGGAGVALAGAAAGCGALPTGESSDDLTFEALHRTAVYIGDGVALSIPDEVQTVRAITNADLIVLSDEPEIDAEASAERFAEERIIALIGDGAESTWLTWVRSDAYDDTFEVNGYADGEPDPDLLVAAAIGLDLTSYNRTWGDGPRNRDVLRALDEILVDIADRRSTSS